MNLNYRASFDSNLKNKKIINLCEKLENKFKNVVNILLSHAHFYEYMCHPFSFIFCEKNFFINFFHGKKVSQYIPQLIFYRFTKIY